MEQSLGKRIMLNRKRLGLTQDQLADKLGVTAQAVSKWENDQSCPDITVIPRLADIFSISTDELLGRSAPAKAAEVIDHSGPEDLPKKLGLIWTSGRKGGIGASIWVILVGFLYMLTGVFRWDISFWSILWPSGLMIFGIFGLFPRFSFFRMGCALLGLYFLATGFFPQYAGLPGRILAAGLITLSGISLLLEALRHARQPRFQPRQSSTVNSQGKNEYHADANSFTYRGNFGSKNQYVGISLLQRGDINTSFGEYTINLGGVSDAAPDAAIYASCSFGELTLQVPKYLALIPDSSTSFASFRAEGEPDREPRAQIVLHSSVSFGEIRVKYI